MADSKPLCNQSVITAAMAYRAKYRRAHEDGKVMRVKLAVGYLGVHPRNRGGVYPAGVRCKTLCREVLGAGFSKEEVNHNCVAVEEVPADQRQKCASDGKPDLAFVSASKYNTEASEKDELLSTCFKEPYADVRHLLLGHNHIMLVMRAVLTRAKWDLERDEKNDVTFCDGQGFLCITAVAESPNGKEMAESMAEGFDCEVPSWKMELGGTRCGVHQQQSS